VPGTRHFHWIAVLIKDATMNESNQCSRRRLARVKAATLNWQRFNDQRLDDNRFVHRNTVNSGSDTDQVKDPEKIFGLR